MFSDIASIQTEIDKLHSEVLSLVLSSITTLGEVYTNYAPYLYEGGYYYIPASCISPYSQHINDVPQVSLMIIEDEQQAKNICGRTRLSCQASLEIVNHNSAEFIYITDQLRQRVGKTMDLLVALNDFQLFRVSPQMGNLMLGLSKAYPLQCNDTTTDNYLPQLQIA